MPEKKNLRNSLKGLLRTFLNVLLRVFVTLLLIHSFFPSTRLHYECTISSARLEVRTQLDPEGILRCVRFDTGSAARWSCHLQVLIHSSSQEHGRQDVIPACVQTHMSLASGPDRDNSRGQSPVLS